MSTLWFDLDEVEEDEEEKDAAKEIAEDLDERIEILEGEYYDLLADGEDEVICTECGAVVEDGIQCQVCGYMRESITTR